MPPRSRDPFAAGGRGRARGGAGRAGRSGRAESLRAALSLLTSKQREALVLRELEGRSYSEIATTLGVTESAVETLLFRARRAVREQLEDVLGCDAACALIEQETLSDAQRRLLRAHTRA